MGYRNWLAAVAGIILGLIFLVSGLGKISGHSSYFVSVANLAMFPDFVKVLINDFLPWGEIVLGLVLVTGTVTQAAALVSSVMVTAFIFQNSWMIAHGYRNEP